MKKLFYLSLLLLCFSVNTALAQESEEIMVPDKKYEVSMDFKSFFVAVMGAYGLPHHNIYLMRNIKNNNWLKLGFHAELGHPTSNQGWYEKIHLNDTIAIQPTNPVNSHRFLVSLGYEKRMETKWVDIFYGASLFAGKYQKTDEKIVDYYQFTNGDYEHLRQEIHRRYEQEQLQLGGFGFLGVRKNIRSWLAASMNFKGEMYWGKSETVEENFLSGERYIRNTSEVTMNMPGLIGEASIHFRF